MSERDGGPAFPGYTMEDDGEKVNITKLVPGMTIRDYFAGQAMQGMLSCQDFMNDMVRSLATEQRSKIEARKELARLAYAMADAMLQERQK